MLQAALAGQGLAYVADNSIAEHLGAGRLVAVLEDWSPAYPGLCLYYRAATTRLRSSAPS